MFKVLQTDFFLEWLGSIKDISTRIRLVRRLDKARQGNLDRVGGLNENSKNRAKNQTK